MPGVLTGPGPSRLKNGSAVSAVLTLFVVPALYSVLARFTRSPEAVSREIKALRGAETSGP